MIMEGGQSGAGVALSVVPLLQERFRQLQRMKELREEKELLRMLMYTTNPTSTSTGTGHQNDYNYEVMMMFVQQHQKQQQQQQQQPPYCQLSLSLWPGAGADCRGSLCREGGPSNVSKSWFAADHNSASDIDTSLHL